MRERERKYQNKKVPKEKSMKRKSRIELKQKVNFNKLFRAW